MQQPGLYFPFIHIRDDNWLKAAALYWPSINRLVPRGYRKHDTRTSQVFVANEILRDRNPGPLIEQMSWDLLHTLEQNANVLKRSYSLERAYRDWDSRQWGYSAENALAQELAWIHFTKFPRDVVRYLSENGLAQIGQRTSHSGEWIGVHPALAGAYMTVLANRLSETAYFQPLTDQADLRVATPTSEIQSALNLLLGPISSNLGATAEGVETYVMLALQHVRPKDLGNASAEKIIACREDLHAELQAFRGYVAAQQAELSSLSMIPAQSRKLEAFAEHVEQTVKVPLQELEKSLRLFGLEPTRSLLLIGSVAPPFVAEELLHAVSAPSIAATTVGTMAAIGGAWWQVNATRGQAKAKSPVGYLLDIRDRLTPKTLPSQVRKILRGTYGYN